MQQLLRHLASGKPQTVGELARQLNMTEGLILIMAAQLVQLGYLQETGSCELPADGNPSNCGGCSGCSLTSPRHGWALTEKGFKAAQKIS